MVPAAVIDVPSLNSFKARFDQHGVSTNTGCARYTKLIMRQASYWTGFDLIEALSILIIRSG